MSTSAQILANQANAQKSTGPTTEEGKETSSRNNTQHGLAVKKFSHKTFFMFQNEDMAVYRELLAGFVKEYDTADQPSEYLLCEQMAQHSWLRSRAIRLQTACFDGNLAVSDKENFELYVRYENSQNRGFHRSLNNLLKVKAAKAKAQIGFESQMIKMASIAMETNANSPVNAPPKKVISGKDFKFRVPRSAAAPETPEMTENTATPATEIDPGGAKEAA